MSCSPTNRGRGLCLHRREVVSNLLIPIYHEHNEYFLWRCINNNLGIAALLAIVATSVVPTSAASQIARVLVSVTSQLCQGAQSLLVSINFSLQGPSRKILRIHGGGP